MINYYRFCCRIRIADEYADEVPGGEFLAVEDGRAEERREQFADARVNDVSDWFNETPALLAHVRALATGRSPEVAGRLVDTEAACLFLGRDRHGLYRLRREGLLTAYAADAKLGGGVMARSRVMWDVLELAMIKEAGDRRSRKKIAGKES